MDEQIEVILRGGLFRKLMDERAMFLREKYDMKRAELEILYFLSKNETQNTSTDIRKHLLMNKGHISQAVESLCERNYLIAVPDKEDRRYIHYILTKEAHSMVEEIISNRTALTEAVLEGISSEELQVFKSVSKKISRNIEKLL